MTEPKSLQFGRDRVIYKKRPYVTVDNMDSEFSELEQTLTTMGDFMVMNATTTPPSKQADYHVRFADGDGWNPDGKGRGLYMYFDGKWNKFSFS